MSEQLMKLIEMGRDHEMTPEQLEAQRISFAFGNVKLANDDIKKEDVVRASKIIRESRRHEHPVPESCGEDTATN